MRTLLPKISLLLLMTLVAAGVPHVLAAGITGIGYLDQNALANVPSFRAANKKFVAFRDQRQRELFGPLFAAAQTAVASVASSKSLSVVVDKRIVIVGGQDITQNVIDLLESPGAPVPPVNTPPPSTVGWVDQNQIDQLDQFKKAQAQFVQFGEEQRKAAQDKLRSAKTDADRNKIYADYQKAIDDKRKELVQPLVDQTRSAIESVAKKRGLLLVIDRSNLIYGGTDVTSDVVAALKKG